MPREMLTAGQQRALMSLGDLGMRSAAEALARLLGETSALGVSSGELVPLGGAAGLVGPDEHFVAGVAFRLYGGTTGCLVVLFPREAARALVAALSGRAPGRLPGLAEEELSVLKEAGNILGAAYVSAVANRLGTIIIPSIPHLVFDRTEAVLAATLPPKGPGDAGGGLVATRFADSARRVRGTMFFLPEGGVFEGLEDPRDASGG